MQPINQTGWDKYLDRKAAEFLAGKQIIKFHLIPTTALKLPAS